MKSAYEKEIKEFLRKGGAIKQLPPERTLQGQVTARLSQRQEVNTVEEENIYDHGWDGDYTSPINRSDS